MRRLLVRTKPAVGECFGGYLVRLAKDNGYDNAKEFCNHYLSVSRYQPYKVPLRALSDATEIDQKNRDDLWLKYHLTNGYSYRGVRVPLRMISVGKNFCSQCLIEDGVRSARWNLGGVPVCFKHKKLLSTGCKRCQTLFDTRGEATCSCLDDGLANPFDVPQRVIKQVIQWERRLVASKGNKRWWGKQLRILDRHYVELNPVMYGRNYPHTSRMPNLSRYPFSPKQTLEMYTNQSLEMVA